MELTGKVIGVILAILGAFNLYIGLNNIITNEIHCIIGAMCLILSNMEIRR